MDEPERNRATDQATRAIQRVMNKKPQRFDQAPLELVKK